MSVSKGDYVLVTKYQDGDPADHWAVGLYSHQDGDRHFAVDGDGRNFRANGFRRVGKISEEVGAWLLANARDLEMSSPGTNLWDIVAERSASPTPA